MAVQAQYPSNVILPDYRNRARQTFAGNNRNFLSPVSFTQTSFLDEIQVQPHPQPVLEVSNPMHMFNQLCAVADLGHGGRAAPVINNVLYNKAENDTGCNLLASRKRAREDDDLLVNSRQQQQRQLLNIEYHQNHGPASVDTPQTTGVSTGLRLAFEDDCLNSTSSASTSGRVSTSFLAPMSEEEPNTHLLQEREEVEQFFKLQGEQVRQQLEEKRQRYSRALIGVIEEAVLRRLREKDIAIEKFKWKNQELAKHAEQLTVETHHWHAKTKATEALVTALGTNLQQAEQAAVAFSREQSSKEGCGDSEADDAASSHHGDLEDVHARTFRENRELREQRTCKSCRCNDVSILQLPCRHLCLCKDCEARLDACPLCQTLKTASVQVYMS